MVNLSEFRESAARRITKPLLPILSKSRLKPNTLTWIGLAINIVTAGIIATNHLIIGGFLVLFSGLFDLLDGALARSTKQTTRFGAFLDSTVDRLSEAALFLGLLIWYMGDESAVEVPLIFLVLLIFLALVGSFLTSYLRARAEGLGIKCQVGLFTRAGRVIILALGLILSQIPKALLGTLLVLVVFSFVTVGQRLVHVWQQTKN